MQDKSSVNQIPAASKYIMESEDEAIRLDIKTDADAVRRQAAWCGVQSGMRILDAGCGAGITTAILGEMVQPGGSVVGMDYSEARVKYAKEHYGSRKGIEFDLHDLRDPMDDFGEFDLIWVRFVLEYHRNGAVEIVRNMIERLKPGGCLCLLDLDYNCLIHHGLPATAMDTLYRIMNTVDECYNFDTFIGRKLYSFLYDAGLEKISVELMAHNLFYGEISNSAKFNLTKKIEMAAKTAVVNDLIESCYPGGYHQFYKDFMRYLDDPGRFTYTPLLLCKGRRPSGG